MKENSNITLEPLQAQYNALQEKFSQQENLNDELIQSMIKSKLSVFNQHRAEIFLTYGLLIGIMIVSWSFSTVRVGFMLASVVMFLLMAAIEWLFCRKMLYAGEGNDDIQTFEENVNRSNKRYFLLWVFEVFVMCLWIFGLIYECIYRYEVCEFGPRLMTLAISLTFCIFLIFWNMHRLISLCDELSAQIVRSDGENTSKVPSYRHSASYWSGIVMLVLSLIGMNLKLFHLPFGSITFIAASIAGIVYVITTARYVTRVIPECRVYSVITAVAFVFILLGMLFKIQHYPLDNLLIIVGVVLLILLNLIVYLITNPYNLTPKT